MKKFAIYILSAFILCILTISAGKSPKKYELPKTTKSDYVISHKYYTLSFNRKTNCPKWVAWKLTKSMVESKAADRENYDFIKDPLVITSHRVSSYDYRKSGYDRGHMCPAGDCSWNSEAMAESFYMSNMCPQDPTLNRKWWEHLEEAERRWAKQEGTIYIVCGPLYLGTCDKKIGNNVFVTVPSGFFKVILSLRKGHEKAIGFCYTNDANRQTMEDAECPVEYVEMLTGINFFESVDDKIENQVEMSSDLTKWN